MEKTVSLLGEVMRKNKRCGECRTNAAIDVDFEFAFQPIVRLSTREVLAHEALVRGPNGESAFSVLSRVTDRNRYQFDQACRIKAIETAVALKMTSLLAINFLPSAVVEPSACIQTTLAACAMHGFDPSRLVFEVTEGERISDKTHLLRIFETYASLGFGTAIDDFGSGLSGLNLLAEFRPSFAKLDIGLIGNIDADKARQAVVSGIVQTCEMLGTRVIAKGIRRREERDTLANLGIDLMQGYLFSEPALGTLPVPGSDVWD